LTFEEIDCDDVTIDNLDEKSKAMLDKGGITELFPV
jgi:superfamily II helicase